jgi:hypothetical protein
LNNIGFLHDINQLCTGGPGDKSDGERKKLQAHKVEGHDVWREIETTVLESADGESAYE